MRNISILIITLFFLAGCTAVAPIADAVILDKDIRSGEVGEALTSIDLTQAEEQIITHALNAAGQFRADWGRFVSNPEELLSVDLDRLLADYDNLRDRYNEVAAIAVKNFSRYDRQTQMELSMYQERAYSLNDGVQNYLDRRELRKAIRTALSYGFTAVQLVASLK